MPTYTIEGILKLTAPLHVATPGERYVTLNTLYVTHKKPAEQTEYTGITATTVYPVAVTEEDKLEVGLPIPTKDGTGETKKDYRSPEVPVFPANDLRGRLRRLAAQLIFDNVQARGQKISLETYHGMTCGAVTGQPTPGLDFDLATKSGVHPFLGLFGGGPRLVRSSLQISPAWAITSSTLSAGVIPNRYESDRVTDDGYLLRPLFFRRVDDALEFYSGTTSLTVRNYSESVAKWLKDEGAQSPDRDTGTTRSKLRIRTFSAVQYVVPGTRFYVNVRIDTSRTGLASLGLLIHALAHLATKQSIGGWVRNGFGRFETSLYLVLPDGGRLPVLVKEAGVYTPNATGLIADALDAWAEAESRITVEELEDLYSLPSPKEKPAVAK
jgi:CRISPR type IV-associated protein Csf2